MGGELSEFDEHFIKHYNESNDKGYFLEVDVEYPKNLFKAGLAPSKKILFICFNKSPLKMTKNVFYFILKALFVLRIFKFLCWHFGHVEETA